MHISSTLSPAKILKEALTWSAVSWSTVSFVIKSRKASNVTLPVLLGSISTQIFSKTGSFNCKNKRTWKLQHKTHNGNSLDLLPTCSPNWAAQNGTHSYPIHQNDPIQHKWITNSSSRLNWLTLSKWLNEARNSFIWSSLSPLESRIMIYIT